MASGSHGVLLNWYLKYLRLPPRRRFIRDIWLTSVLCLIVVAFAWWREGLDQIGGVVALIVVVGGLSAASNYLRWQAERRLAALLAASGTHGWRQAAVVIDGVSVPLARPTHLVVTDEGYTILVGGKTYQKGTTKMPDRDRPWETDVTVTEGASAGETIRQISKVEGDLLIACNAGGADRPTEFSSREGTGHLLSVWIRVE
jgi:uncharacterized protein (TIGR03067 family)